MIPAEEETTGQGWINIVSKIKRRWKKKKGDGSCSGGSGGVSGFAMLDAVDPNWRETWGKDLKEMGIIDNLILDNQNFIVDYIRQQQAARSVPSLPENGIENHITRQQRNPPPVGTGGSGACLAAYPPRTHSTPLRASREHNTPYPGSGTGRTAVATLKLAAMAGEQLTNRSRTRATERHR